MPDVTEGPRADILACIQRVPGVHLRGIERDTSLPLGQVLYHLDRLERMGIVTSSRDAGFRRYFTTEGVSRGEKPLLMAMRHEVPRRVILALLESPGMPHKELQALVGTAGSTLSFHLSRLVASDVIERARDGLVVRYNIAQDGIARRTLLYHRESFDDPLVDRFARNELARLIPTIRKSYATPFP